MFKVNNKDSVSIVNFEQVNAGWEWPLLARNIIYIYINIIVEFIVIIINNITLYNIVRYIGSKFRSDWHKKMCQFRWPLFLNTHS